MPSLKNINQQRQSATPKGGHRSPQKSNKLSSSTGDVDDQHDVLKTLKIDLQNAIEERKNKKVRELLTKAKADESLKGLFSYNATTEENILHIASRCGNYRIIKRLLNVARDINDNNETLIDLLLSNNQLGENALHIATSIDKHVMVSQLLYSAKNINDNNKTLIDLLLSKNSSNATALHLSTALDSDVITLEILSYVQLVNDNNETLKILINSYDKSGMTALHCAALHGNVMVLTKLLDVAKTIDEYTFESLLLHQDIDGCNALHIASINGDVEVATRLIDIAVNSINIARKLILATNNLNENVLHIAAASEEHNSDALMTKLLNISSNLSVNEYKHEHNVLQKLIVTYNDSGQSSLDVAASNPNKKIIIALLDSIKNIQGSKDIMRELLFHINDLHENPLYISISNENPSIFRNILDTVKNTNDVTFKTLLLLRTGRHDSVLHTLVSKNKITLVEYLLRTIKDRAEVTYHNNMKLLSRYVNLVKGMNEIDSVAKCNDEKILSKIISCFDKDRFNIEDDISLDDFSYVNKYINVYRCTHKIGCFSINDFMNYYTCSKAIEHIEHTNDILISVLKYPNLLGYNVLHLAASNGHYVVIQKLLDAVKYIDSWNYNSTKQYDDDNKCIDVVTKNYDKISVENLLKEIKSNNTMLKEYLLSTTELDGGTALHIAVKAEYIEVVKKLLRYAKNIQDNDLTLKTFLVSNDKVGDTALYIAVKAADIEIVKKLLRYAKNIQDNDLTLKTLLMFANKLLDTDLFKACTEKSQYYDTVALILTEAKKVGIIQTPLKMHCITKNDKLKDHGHNLDSNSSVSIKSDTEHKQKEITQHYDNYNTQGSTSTISPILTQDLKLNTLKSVPHSIDNYNTTNKGVIADFNIGFTIGGILMFLRYFFPNKSASGTHYISPDTQHTIQLDELASKVEQSLLGAIVPDDN